MHRKGRDKYNYFKMVYEHIVFNLILKGVF